MADDEKKVKKVTSRAFGGILLVFGVILILSGVAPLALGERGFIQKYFYSLWGSVIAGVAVFSTGLLMITPSARSHRHVYKWIAALSVVVFTAFFVLQTRSDIKSEEQVFERRTQPIEMRSETEWVEYRVAQGQLIVAGYREVDGKRVNTEFFSVDPETRYQMQLGAIVTDRGTILSATNGFVVLPSGKLLIARALRATSEQERGAIEYYFETHVPEDALYTNIVYRETSPHQFISLLFEVTVDQNGFLDLVSLDLIGGEGGVFRMNDGTIYVSHNPIVNRNGTGGLLGAGPYSRYDVGKKILIRMPDNFVPDLDDVVQPNIALSTLRPKPIAELGPIKLVSEDNRFYIYRR